MSKHQEASDLLFEKITATAKNISEQSTVAHGQLQALSEAYANVAANPPAPEGWTPGRIGSR